MYPEDARYEYRAWAKDLGDLRTRLESLSSLVRKIERTEHYLVVPGRSAINVKIRAGKLDIKVLVEERDGFERWAPRFEVEFPIPAEVLRVELFPLLDAAVHDLTEKPYSWKRLHNEVASAGTGVAAVEVTKKRFMFEVAGCIAEFSKIAIDGRKRHSVAVESTDLEALRKARRKVGIHKMENLSYPAAITRTLGLEES